MVFERVVTGSPIGYIYKVLDECQLCSLRGSQRGVNVMAKIHYRIVAHDGGWAYKLEDVFSEPFPSKAADLAAAKLVACEQHIPGDTTHI